MSQDDYDLFHSNVDPETPRYASLTSMTNAPVGDKLEDMVPKDMFDYVSLFVATQLAVKPGNYRIFRFVARTVFGFFSLFGFFAFWMAVSIM